MCPAFTTGWKLFFIVFDEPSKVQISAQKVQVARGLIFGSTKTIPFLIFPSLANHFSANFPKLIANEHIYPEITCLTGIFLQWIPFISTFLKFPSEPGPKSSYCLTEIPPLIIIPWRISSPSLLNVSMT